jgi:hypothetical protein
MSVALNILNGPATDALVATHGDALTLRPSGAAVTGYAQELNGTDPQESGIRKTRAPMMFHFGEDLISHIVHIRRGELTAVTLADVASIEQAGTTKKYRVKHVSDDPNNSEVAFYCTLS